MWFASPLQLDVRTLGYGDFLACWMALLALYEKRGRVEEVLQLVAFVLWRIWKCRNALVFNGVLVQPCEAVALLLKQVDEFNEVQAVEHTQVQRQGVTFDLLVRLALFGPALLRVWLSLIAMGHGRLKQEDEGWGGC
ncbi:hypothetical protein GBA52_007013 [Prunus armeniaca]|nr:hypothetical protein GBA52_007013 [Prunus armeniaca]